MWTYGVACHIPSPGSGEAKRTVGVQYRDRCRRTARGWLIHDRKALVQWTIGPLPSRD